MSRGNPPLGTSEGLWDVTRIRRIELTALRGHGESMSDIMPHGW